jgi:putative salt-induced outer membrane protein YdiY
MFEYEEVADGVTPIQRDIRGSSYISFSLYPTDNLTLISTTYYQPKLVDFSDYRISSQSSLLVNLFTSFALKTTYTFIYDDKPAIGIPSSQYSFTTGVSYSFD